MNRFSDSFINTILGSLISNEPKSIISGPFGSNIGKRFFQNEGIPVIRGNNLSINTIKFIDSGFVFVTKGKADELNCYAVTNDIIFTAVGTIGQVGIIEDGLLYDEYVISNKQIRVRFDSKKILPLYAYYWFSSKWMQNIISQRNVGSTVPLLNLSVVRGLPIKLPRSIITQRNIVRILEDVTSKIEINKRINAELEAMAKTLYDYWFVQFDFPNAEGKPYKPSGGKMVWNEELKREIPKGWEVENIEKCCSIVDCLHSKKSELVFEDEESFLLQLENINDNGLIDLMNRYYVTKAEYKIWTSRIEVVEDDILITNAGRVAATAQIPRGIKAGIGRNITAIRPNTIKPTYLFLAFRGMDMVRQIKWNTDSGAFFTSLNVKGIKKLFIARPPDGIAEKFEKIVKPIRQKREINNLENQQLSELRDWLLPMLMNGQVTVGDITENKASYKIEEEMRMAAKPGS